MKCNKCNREVTILYHGIIDGQLKSGICYRCYYGEHEDGPNAFLKEWSKMLGIITFLTALITIVIMATLGVMDMIL